MACKEADTLNALFTIAQCSICIDTFDNPRVLPCAHTFCLKCLEKTQSRIKAQCALCRKPFDIPLGGLSELPRNAMIQDLLDLSKQLKSCESSETVEEKQMTMENTVTPEAPPENTESTGTTLPTDALHCGNCNNCEHCSRAQDVASNDQMKEQSTETKELPELPGDTESLCDVCLINNSDGNQKVWTATLHCMDCNENQCEKCSAEHMRQRLCKHHKVVSLEDHLKEKLLQKEETDKAVVTTIFCDICLDNNENGTAAISEATLHCIDCSENQCEDCSREHKRQRLCKDHKIVELDDQLRDELIKIKKMARSTNEDIFCDVCAENSENGAAKITATWHCIYCEENQCDDCSREHKRQRLFKSHKCVALDDQMKEKLLKAKKMSNATEVNILCDICKEKNEIGKENIAATLFCTECKENQCEDCSKEHKRQRFFKNHQIIVLDAQMKEKLLNVKEIDKKPDLEIICDICAENSELGETWSAATLHCIECDEKQCNNCNKEHIKQSSFRNHEIIPIDDHMMSNISEMKAEADILCDMCVGNCANQTADVIKATLYCTECQENQCEECNRTHLRQKQFREHKVVAISVQMQQKAKHPRTCSVHIKDQLKFYCFTCQQVICMKCVDKEHNSHEYQFACNVAEGFLNDIDGYLENVDSWLQQGDITKHELQGKGLETENVHKVSRKSDHSYISDDSRSPKKHQLNTRMELMRELDEHLGNLSSFKRRCNGLKAHKSSVNICLVMNELRIRFEELQRQQELYSPERLLPRGASSFAVPKTLNSSSTSPYSETKLLKWKKLLDNELKYMLKEDNFSKIRHTAERPTIKEPDLENFWRFALPYIIQRIKTWNGYVLTAQNIAAMVERTPKQKRDPRSSDNAIQESTTYPVSRLDCIAYIINAADSIVVQDILRIMSKFPMAIPLVIPDITEIGKYIVVVPAMQNIIVKWESTPGQIAENHLFSSPFRMICAVRLGTNKFGKSTILNQLMRKQFMFSSSGEPGSRYGCPLTLDGTVEIVWLTQETCSDTTWKTTACDHYKRDTSEVAILANLHGDALQYPDTLKYLEHLACSFIVFRMPNSTDDEFQQLTKSISSQNLVPVLIDPKKNLDEESETETIYTDSLSSDDTQDTVRSLLRSSLNFHSSTNSKPFFQLEESRSLKYTESLQCKRSENILDIVRKQGCFNIKQLLLNIDVQQHSKWTESLKRLLGFSLDIINQDQSNAKKSLTYLENQLSQISANESVTARAQVSEANEKFRRIVKAPKKLIAEGDSEERQHQAEFNKAQDELKSAMEKVDNINLGQEHFFRALGQMYEKSFGVTDMGDFYSVRDLPSRIADLLISGHAIEMLNGDSGEMQLVWIKAICENVTKKLSNLKVFVISIIGLQSSGKSTLLNALFSCRFAVSVGRCSRGLFMRMILLDEKLRKIYGCDAFILIDTEGLCSPEKMNDPKASQKDRLMATFAMGVSNLTIVNILGEGMTEMTEVLQIAIVAMARLRGGGIKPDILMVQHLQERNLSKIDQAKGQFCEAINKAFELISKNDVEIGSASEECLAELTVRIQSGDIFKHFGAFRDGSSVNSPPSETYHEDVISLFETLLNRTRASEKKSTFERWSNHFESYWACVRGENFALNFKNVKHITDFLYYEKKVAKVKELNDSSMRHHREFFANKIRERINLVIENKRKVRTDSMRKDMLDEMEQKLKAIPHDCPDTCGMCKEFKSHYISLLQEIENGEWGEETKHSLNKYNDRLHEITMKVLRQTFDGSVVKQGYFSEFSDLITKELKHALERRPTGEFSEEEQREIVDGTWQFLQGIAASKESAPDLDIRLIQALHQEYVISGVWPTILQDLTMEISVAELLKTKATKSVWSQLGVTSDKLTKDQMTNLISNLNQLVETVLKSRREDCFATGLDFEEGMVSEIRTKFPRTIKQYEKKFNITLYDSFKMYLQIYTLQQLRHLMTGLQDLWNSQNKPSEILQRKKDDYINEIETRLKYGFSCAGEGEIVAKRLCKSIKRNAIQAGYDVKIQTVKDAQWTTNSEKVRLYYFEQLAKEVAVGKKERALVHFANPKDSIESWFTKEVDSLHSEKSVLETYHSTLEHELNRVKQQISNSDNKADIDKIVKEQIKTADDQYYSQLDPKDDDFDAFRSSIVRILDSFKDSEDSRQVEFGLASNDPEIQRRLGCSEHCFWCGALCWGSRDHRIGRKSNLTMEAHLSCHQPHGLKGIGYRNTNKLSSVACHNTKDEWSVHFGVFQEGNGMLWSEAKRNHFKDWKFDSHCVTTFDELMRWFFQQLHRDIAKSQGSFPADEKELRENGCKDLSLYKILEVVRSKI